MDTTESSYSVLGIQSTLPHPQNLLSPKMQLYFPSSFYLIFFQPMPFGHLIICQMYIYEVQLPNMKSLFQDLFVSSSIRFMSKKVCLAWFPKENKKIKHLDVSGTERNCKYELAAEELKETPSMAPSAKVWCRWIRSSLYQSYAQHLHHPSITGAADGGRMSCVLREEVGRGGTGTGPPSWSRCKGSASSNGSIK